MPTLWKVCATPAALRVRLTWDRDGAWLTATRIASHDVRTAAVHADRSSVNARLERLADAGQINSRHGVRNAVLWFPRSADHG